MENKSIYHSEIESKKNKENNKIIVGISGSYLDDNLIENAIEISDENTEICLLYVIIIPKSKALDIEDEKSFTKAENMKDFFNAFQIKELKKYAHFVF